MSDPQTLVEISIDELVLEGFAPSEKYRIGEAVQLELERLFLQEAHTKELGASTREIVDAGTFPMTNIRGDVIGAQIAQAVFESFQKPE